MKIVAYDLDGVLAESPLPNDKKWGLMNGAERKERKEYLREHYLSAKPIYNPPEKSFYVITARKTDTKAITAIWLDKHFPKRVAGLFMLDVSRTIENVVNFKTQVLLNIKAEVFVEDNKKVLVGIKKRLPLIITKLFPQEVI